MFFFKNYAENEAGRQVPDLSLFYKNAQYEVKESRLQLSFNMFQQPATWHKMKTNSVKPQTIDPEIEICSILIFQKMVWDQFLHQILCMTFQEKCFSCYNLLTDQISLSDCLYFLKYWAICVLRLFVNQAVTSQILKLTSSPYRAVLLHDQKVKKKA